MFLVFPVLILVVIALVNAFLTKKGFQSSIKTIAFSILPIIALAHVFKAFLKMASRIPYWDLAIADPNGVYYASEIANKSFILPKFEMLDSLVVVIGIALLATGLILSMKKVWKSETPLGSKLFVSSFVLFYWLLLEYGPV